MCALLDFKWEDRGSGEIDDWPRRSADQSAQIDAQSAAELKLGAGWLP